MVSFDDSLWPLLNVNFVGATTDQEFEEYLAKMSQYLKRGDKYVCIFDTSKMTDSPLTHRQRQIEWLKQNDAALRQWMLGTCFVITSPMLRLVMNIIHQISKPASPSTAVSTVKAGLEWAAGRFQAEGLTVPAMLIRTRGLIHGFINNRTA